MREQDEREQRNLVVAKKQRNGQRLCNEHRRLWNERRRAMRSDLNKEDDAVSERRQVMR